MAFGVCASPPQPELWPRLRMPPHKASPGGLSKADPTDS